MPVFHIGYLWHIVKILQCICKVRRSLVFYRFRIVRGFCYLIRLGVAIYLFVLIRTWSIYRRKCWGKLCTSWLAEQRFVLTATLSMVRLSFRKNFLGTVKKGSGLSYVVHDTSKNLARKVDKQLTKYANGGDANPEICNLARKCVVRLIIKPLNDWNIFTVTGGDEAVTCLRPFFKDSNPRSSFTFDAFWLRLVLPSPESNNRTHSCLSERSQTFSHFWGEKWDVSILGFCNCTYTLVRSWWWFESLGMKTI